MDTICRFSGSRNHREDFYGGKESEGVSWNPEMSSSKERYRKGGAAIFSAKDLEKGLSL